MSEYTPIAVQPKAILKSLNSNNGGNPYNQDRGFTLSTPIASWIIIADGNGMNGGSGGVDFGSLAADTVTRHVIECLSNLAENPPDGFFTKLFKDANDAVRVAFDKIVGPGNHKTLAAGCTLTIIGQLSNRDIITAYVGDSPAGMIIQRKDELAECVSLIDGYQHSPDNIEEGRRIVGTGCSIAELFYELIDGSRLPIYVQTEDGIQKKVLTEAERALLKPCDIYFTPAQRIRRLNMSRSMGNFDLEHLGVTAVPTVVRFSPFSGDAIAIWAGSDGLSDTTPKEAILHSILRTDVVGSEEEATEALLHAGVEFGHKKFGAVMDNIVVGVLFDYTVRFQCVAEVVGAKKCRIETLEGENVALGAELASCKAELASCKAASAAVGGASNSSSSGAGGSSGGGGGGGGGGGTTGGTKRTRPKA